MKVQMKIFAAVLVVLAAACKVDQPCDSRSVYENRTCRPLPPDAGEGGEAGSASDAVTGDLGGGAPFGATCTEHAHCTGTTNACLIPPGDTMGFCSYVECDKRPGVCPAMWNCCDLSRLSPGAPYGCIPLPACP
jgi:hypothetical protein